MPAAPPEVRWESTGRTFAEEWAERDGQGQRQLMVSCGFRVLAGMIEGRLVSACELDQDLAKRAGRVVVGEPVSVPEMDGLGEEALLQLAQVIPGVAEPRQLVLVHVTGGRVAGLAVLRRERGEGATGS